MSKICCFTGHRKISAEEMSMIPEVLDKVLEALFWQGVHTFRAGGAVGFDTVAALAVLEKKKKYPEIRLCLELPCRDQTKGWGEGDVRAYEYILERADSVNYAFDKYNRGCMMVRNRKLVDGADFCVAFCLSNKGGSAYTVNYALKKGVSVINLADIIGKIPKK